MASKIEEDQTTSLREKIIVWLEKCEKLLLDVGYNQMPKIFLDGHWHYEDKKTGCKIDRRGEGIADFFFKTFGPSGYDAIKKTVDGQANAKNYLYNLITILATLLGLSTYMGNLDAKQSWGNIGRQFIGWNHDGFWLNLLSMLFFIPFNTLTLLPKLAVNLAKIVTEVLPHILHIITARLFIRCRNLHVNSGQFISSKGERGVGASILASMIALLGLAISMILGALVVAFSIWYYVGRAVTSPIDSVREDWLFWREYKPRNPRA